MKTRVRIPNSAIGASAKILGVQRLAVRVRDEVLVQTRKLRGRHLAVVFPPDGLAPSRSSQTIYLSFGLRPVCTPVSAQSAPPDVSCASPPLRAHSYSSGSSKFQLTP